MFSLILVMGMISPVSSTSWNGDEKTSSQREFNRFISSEEVTFPSFSRDGPILGPNKISSWDDDNIRTLRDEPIRRSMNQVDHFIENGHFKSDFTNSEDSQLIDLIALHKITPLQPSKEINTYPPISSTVKSTFPKATATVANSNPIQINGDADFANQAATNGWPGDGSINNPYIIENLVIIANGTPAIEIMNTNANFIIRNSTLIGSWNGNMSAMAGGVAGIFFQNVNGRAILDGNTITNFSGDGINLKYSRVRTVNTVVYNNGYSGLYSEGSNYLNFSSNIVYNNTGPGLYILDSDVYTVVNNTISGNSGDGIVISFINDVNLYASSRVTRANRVMANQGSGFVIEGYGSQVTGNLAEDNGNAGFFFYPKTLNSKISNNTAKNNVGIGFHVNSTGKMELTNNSALGNGETGFFVWEDWSSVITSNVASANKIGFHVLDDADRTIFANNTATKNIQDGFFIENTRYFTIEDNLASLNGWSGFYFLSTSIMTVKRSTAVQNNRSGFYTGNSDQITFVNNLASHNGLSGFVAYPVYANYIFRQVNFTNNDANNNQYNGFFTLYHDVILNNNAALGNGLTGFRIIGNYGSYGSTGYPYRASGVVTATNDSAWNNGLAGFWFKSLDTIVVQNNVLGNNTEAGIIVDFSRNNTILNNDIQNNGIVFKKVPFITALKIENNTVNGNPVIFIQHQQDVTLNGVTAGQIILFDVSRALITNQVISGTDIAFQLLFTSDSILRNNVALNNRLHGFFLSYSTNNSLVNNSARYNGRHGFTFSDGLMDTVLKNNTAEFNGKDGFSLMRNFTISNSVFFENNDFRDNIAKNNGNTGFFIIRFRYGKVTNNVVQGNAQHGFSIVFESKYNLIQDNFAMGNGIDGFYLHNKVEYNTFTRNTADSNLRNGYHLHGVQHDTFTNNSAVNNGNNGFYLDVGSTSNGFQDNTAWLNKNSGFTIDDFSRENRFTSNEAHHNVENGFVVNGTSLGNVLTSNLAFSNSLNGFYLYSSTNNTLISNVAFLNNKTGFVIVETAISSTYQYQGGAWVKPLLVGNRLEQNIAHDNAENGFKLDTTSNNTLINNVARTNAWVGFSIEHASKNNTLSSNMATFNGQGGFVLWFSNIRNQLMNNTASHNNGSGFALVQSNSTALVSNIAMSNGQSGFVLNDSDNNTLKDNIARDNLGMGLFLILGSTDNLLIGNMVANNTFYGILLQASWNNILLDNVLHDGDGVVLGGTTVKELSQQLVSGNMVNGKPLVFLQHQRQVTMTTAAGQIILVNSSFIQIQNQVITDTEAGIQLLFSDRNTIEKSTVSFNSFIGIFLMNSSGNQFSNNIVSYNSMIGFYVTDSSVENVFSHDVVVGNLQYGIRFDATSGSNKVLYNDFWLNNNNDKIQAHSDSPYNEFSNNFWDTHRLPDTNQDGIVDSPQLINGSGGLSDQYPLTKPSGTFDTKAPSISGMSDVVYAHGTTGHLLSWEVLDENGGKYLIFYNGTLVEQGSWTPNDLKAFSVDDLEVGFHIYEIVFIDVFNNTNSFVSFVTVIEATIPSLTTPSDLRLELGSTGWHVNWTVTDVESGIYEIYQNGTLIASGGWNSGDELVISLDSLTIGVYNYTLVVTDIFGVTTSDTVIVTVVNEVGPTVSSPQDITYEEGATGNIITWLSTDPNPDNYEIYQNGSLIASGSWYSGVNISITVDGLPIGVHNFTVIVSDVHGVSSRDTVLVFVVDGTSPVLNSPPDVVYREGDVGQRVTWSATDAHPNSYEIYQNGTVIATGTWTTGNDITVTVDGLTLGVHNYTLVVSDMSGNLAHDTVFVIVIRDDTTTTTPPSSVTTTTSPSSSSPTTVTSSDDTTTTNQQSSTRTTTSKSETSQTFVTTAVTTPFGLLGVIVALGLVIGFRGWKSSSRRRSR